MLADELRLHEVLDSAQKHFPSILAQQASRDATAQQPDIARSAFDPVLTNESFARTTGSFDGRVTDTQLSKRIGVANARIYSGYRISRGDFPIYEDILFSNSGGETKVGIELSLLRDREIDPERLALITSGFEVDSADLDVLRTRFEVQRQATRSYKRWQAAGFRLDVYRGLLKIAEERNVALERRVGTGDAAPILLVENQRNLIRRKERVNIAEQLLAVEAQTLSLYWRDATGNPLLATASQLPPEWTKPDAINTNDFEAIVEAAKSLRPDILRLENDIAIQTQQLALERNRLAPKLDAGLEISNDFGSGRPSSDGTDVILSMNFELPIGLVRQRSIINAEQAKLLEIKQKRRLAEDELRVGVGQLISQLTTFYQAIDLAVEAEEYNRQLEQAERKLFAQGASDFFLLNIREENTAEAQIRRINAKEQFLLTRTDYYAATAQAGPLGL